ncbi:50S ribosome-binding GTPase [Moellerella wisconsensis]|uniref:GTPase family protein n=1 Tax=Moellerella wisconsensis TaxID=158849 RepID=UPI001F4D80A2|nr:GTPase [Moellerella wisconsensis]UNH27880.1 50S ribosome-binding GTPase [Moellerella wisconsensis]
MPAEKIISSILSESIPSSLQQLKTELTQELNSLVNYSPTIGIMGKTGAGKSSLCNALFQSTVSQVSDIGSGTCTAQRLCLSVGKRTLTLIDLPGIGESQQRDKAYQQLYQQTLPELDLVIWVLRADERAWTSDETTYRFLIEQCGYERSRFLFVLNQADKIEPCREWHLTYRQPSATQLHHLQQKITTVQQAFSPHHPVISISAKEGYQIHLFVELLIRALPANASSPTLRQLQSTHRNTTVNTLARQDFGQSVCQLIDDVIDALPLASSLANNLVRVKETVVYAALAVWKWLF